MASCVKKEPDLSRILRLKLVQKVHEQRQQCNDVDNDIDMK